MAFRIISWSLILFACFWGLSAYPLLDHNEGLYAAIARDMLGSGDFIIPHLNGVPYIEKPPLLYWLMAASMKLFGENEWAVRLIPALALFGTAWKCSRFLRRIGAPEAGLMAAVIFATSLPMLAIGRMVLCDMLMTCFLSTALILFYEWREQLHPPGRGQKYLLGFYVFLALAVMTKGFVTVILAGGTIATMLLWQRAARRDWIAPLSPLGIALFLLIIAPWHIAATLQEPGFAWFYFINEHVLRFLNMREPHDYYTGHVWYYLVRIPGYVIPWTLFLFLLLPPPLRGRVGEGGSHKDNAFSVAPLPPERLKNDIRMSFFEPFSPSLKGRGNINYFLWFWFLFCLAFFSASGGKANYYMIAGMPPLVMLLALRMEHAMKTDPRLVRGLASIALILIISTLEWLQFACHDGNGIYPMCQIISWPVIGAVAFYVLAAIALVWRLPPRWIVPLMGANILLLLPLLISGVGITGDRISQKPVADYLHTSFGGNAAIYQEFEELSALAFYLPKPLTLVDSHSSDLLYGQQQRAAPAEFISLAEWIAEAHPQPMVILNKHMDSVMSANHNLCVARRFERVSVIQRCNK